jgi:hypothetical protein
MTTPVLSFLTSLQRPPLAESEERAHTRKEKKKEREREKERKREREREKERKRERERERERKREMEAFEPLLAYLPEATSAAATLFCGKAREATLNLEARTELLSLT